jgi:hypothetical protein
VSKRPHIVDVSIVCLGQNRTYRADGQVHVASIRTEPAKVEPLVEGHSGIIYRIQGHCVDADRVRRCNGLLKGVHHQSGAETPALAVSMDAKHTEIDGGDAIEENDILALSVTSEFVVFQRRRQQIVETQHFEGTGLGSHIGPYRSVPVLVGNAMAPAEILDAAMAAAKGLSLVKIVEGPNFDLAGVEGQLPFPESRPLHEGREPSRRLGRVLAILDEAAELASGKFLGARIATVVLQLNCHGDLLPAPGRQRRRLPHRNFLPVFSLGTRWRGRQLPVGYVNSLDHM